MHIACPLSVASKASVRPVCYAVVQLACLICLFSALSDSDSLDGGAPYKENNVITVDSVMILGTLVSSASPSHLP